MAAPNTVSVPGSVTAGDSFDAAKASSPLPCVRRAAGLPASASPLRHVFAADFEGRAAWIGAFLRARSVRVFVVARPGCSLLYSTTRSIG
jgi:hypothetical protein